MHPQDVLVSFERASGRLEDLLNLAPDLPHRVPGVAAVLRETWPEARYYGCFLRNREEAELAVLDAQGSPQAGGEGLLGLSLGPAGHEWCASGAPDAASSDPNALLRPVAVGTEAYGFLALVLPSGASPADRPLARLFLENVARLLELRLALESARRERQAAREAAESLDRLADVGELAGPLAHEFTNFLHVLLLQVSVLEFRMPEGVRTDLAEIRRQGNLAAEVVTHFHEYRRSRSESPRPVDLRAVVREVAAQLTRGFSAPVPVLVSSEEIVAGEPDPGAVVVTLVHTGEDARVTGNPQDLNRLVRFLLGNAIRAAAQQGNRVTVTTEATGGHVVLSVEDDGPTPPETDFVHLFEPSAPNREGVETLELAACRSMVRRLNGNLRAEPGAPGGVRIVIEFAEDSLG